MITELKPNQIFVFGSNTEGKHIGGAALQALNSFGAKMGKRFGIQGQSFAIPTISYTDVPITLEDIEEYVYMFLLYAKNHLDKEFLVTEIGCGIAGWKPEEIKPFFKHVTTNVVLPDSFKTHVIQTYKMTDENMQCRGIQYEIGKTYTHDGGLKICNYGIHSCQTAQNCLSYYNNDGKNRLFLCEVEVKGNEQFENGDIDNFEKICSDNITFIKELTEISSKFFNSGDFNSGDFNSGDRNSGDRNSGDFNSGHWNSGHWNSGDRNSGDFNSGDFNSGDRNSGDRNSGHWNSGHWNSGHWNSGDFNSGHWNSGDRNSGHWNSGHWNSGDFNTTDSPWRCFNEFQSTKKSDHYFPSWLYFDLIEWRYESDMTNSEKENYPYYNICGGCLIVKDYKQAAQESYNKATKEEQDSIEKLPSYNADILFELFGIDRRKK
jgi:Pentapeptide repeats (8 copies)